MSRMKQQPKNGLPTVQPITWPTLNIPESDSPIKGLTQEQHEAFNGWYLGVQNSINSHNAAVHSTLNDLQSRIDSLEKNIAATKTP